MHPLLQHFHTPHHHPWIYWGLFQTNSTPPGWPGISQDDSNERRPAPPLNTLYPGVGVLGWYPQEPSRPHGPPTCQISSRSIQCIGFHTHTLPPAPLGGGAQIKKQKNLPLLKFDFRQILFYKYCTILKKIYPSRSPLDTCSSWSRG